MLCTISQTSCLWCASGGSPAASSACSSTSCTGAAHHQGEVLIFHNYHFYIITFDFRHLTSTIENENDEFDDVTVEHPGDRIADANDENGIHSDWSKIYEAESELYNEIQVFPYKRRGEIFNRQKRVTFKEDQSQEDSSATGSNIVVDVEINPYNSTKKLEKSQHVVSSNKTSPERRRRKNKENKAKREQKKCKTDRQDKSINHDKEEEISRYDASLEWNQNYGFDRASEVLEEIEDGEFTVEALKAKWSKM